MRARLHVQAVGTTRWEQENGDYDSPQAAEEAGRTMIANGAAQAFEVWEHYGTWERETGVKKTDGREYPQ